MTTSAMIRELCVKQNISLAELYRRIGQTPPNFNKKMKRGTVSAEEMLKIANEHNIKIHQDENLAEVLSTLEVYENLDDDLYEAVSQILQELYIINKNLP